MKDPSSQTFQITGMDCADCARTLEKGVSQLEGVLSSRVIFTNETLVVSGDAPEKSIITRVRELGYDVLDPKSEAGEPAPSQPENFLRYLYNRADTRTTFIAIFLLIPGLIFHELLPGLSISHPLIDISSVLAMLLAGWPIARSGWRAFRINRSITINALMSIAAVGAVIIGEYTEAGVVMVLFVIGEALEGFAAGRARQTIRSLIKKAPNTATLLENHEDKTLERTVAIEQLIIGDVILVKPGQAIPMDGRVVAGISFVNQSPITGESSLVEKYPNDEVFASSINYDGTLEIEVTRLSKDNTIARLIRMVEEAQEKRAPTQRFVDRFSAVYTPIVVVLAACVAIIPPLFFNQPFWDTSVGHGWLYRGLALLVIACPCALVISTPVSLISAISNAARHGVIFKGGAFIEALSQIKAIAFDKTGTITVGKPVVRRVRAANCEQVEERCAPCDDLLALVSAVESRSEHPIAHAVMHEARHTGVNGKFKSAQNVKALTGRGVTGTVDGEEVTVGSHAYFEENYPHLEHCAEITAEDERGHTTMLVQKGPEYIGYLTVSDELRPEAAAVISQLRGMGLQELKMLTGDHETTAAEVAQLVGITSYTANCLPENKVDEINALVAEHKAVAMVGDGINDTPALASATVGIAIGSSPQAMETADVSLMADSLRQLPFALRLSRAAMRKIRFNVAFSIGIKVLFFLLVLAGFGTMWMAVLADMGTSLLVTVNGVRLLNHPKLEIPEGRSQTARS